LGFQASIMRRLANNQMAIVMTRRLPLVPILVVLISQTATGQRLHEILYSAGGTLCSVAANGGPAVCVRSGADFDSPAWQPGGASIVAGAGEDEGPSALVLLDSTGRRIRRLDRSSGSLRPAWSGDGLHIFAVGYAIGRRVARWNADGRGRVMLPVNGG
jgi:hypothetical protein